MGEGVEFPGTAFTIGAGYTENEVAKSSPLSFDSSYSSNLKLFCDFFEKKVGQNFVGLKKGSIFALAI